MFRSDPVFKVSSDPVWIQSEHQELTCSGSGVFFIEGGSGQYPAGSSTLYEAEDKNIGYTVVHTLHRHFRNNYEKDK